MKATECPRWIVLQLVDHCNLRCSMCYQWGSSGSYHRKTSLQLDFEAIRRVVRDCAPSRPFFELFGGEPFLYPKIEDVIELIVGAGCELGIPTNGTLLGNHVGVLVGDRPIRVWVSLDGPEDVNDLQRGPGVFGRAVEGIERVWAARQAGGHAFPKLGVTFVVTPVNHTVVERFFVESIDLSKIDFVIIVLQNFATKDQCDRYETIVRQLFGGTSAEHARGYLEELSRFSDMDITTLSEQIETVRRICRERGVLYLSHPMTIDHRNVSSYFGGRWHELSDHRNWCGFPWMYAEISASGDVTTCHSFYDITVGNVYDRSILEIWRGERIERVRNHVKTSLFPICTACCRYYNNPTSAVLRGMETTHRTSLSEESMFPTQVDGSLSGEIGE